MRQSSELIEYPDRNDYNASPNSTKTDMPVASLIAEINKKAPGKPATAEAVEEAEQSIGYKFPPLLRSIYLEVANGGIGPGYQILGVKGGHLSEEGDSISDLYDYLKQEDPIDELWVWPKEIVPFCPWGNAIYSCFNAEKPDNPIVWFDPNAREIGEPMEQQFITHRESLESWLQGWINDEDLWAETHGA